MVAEAVGSGRVSVAEKSGSHTSGFGANRDGLSWAAEVAAYLRAQGVEAEVRREDRRKKTASKAPFASWLPAVYHVTVPAEAQAEAQDLVAAFERSRRRYSDTIPWGGPLNALSEHRVRFGMREWGGKVWFAWYGVFAKETSVCDAEYGVWAYEMGGEVWRRYRDLFRSEGQGPRHVGGFFRCGASWAFNADFSGVSDSWLNQSPEAGAGRTCKRLYLIGEEVLHEQGIAGSPVSVPEV